MTKAQAFVRDLREFCSQMYTHIGEQPQSVTVSTELWDELARSPDACGPHAVVHGDRIEVYAAFGLVTVTRPLWGES